MTNQEVLDSLTRILSDLLANDSIQLTAATRREDVAGWDSFSYINFIVAVEQQFDIKFGVAEVESFENVGAIVQRTLALSTGRDRR